MADPVSMATGAGLAAATGGLSLAVPLIQAGIAAIPGPMERQMRQQVKADLKRTAGGRGGLSAGMRQKMIAEGRAAAQGQQAEELAQMARGSAAGVGAAAGQQQQQLASIQKAKQAGLARTMSDIREQDLALAEQVRQGALQRQAEVGAMKRANADKALGALGSILTPTEVQTTKDAYGNTTTTGGSSSAGTALQQIGAVTRAKKESKIAGTPLAQA